MPYVGGKTADMYEDHGATRRACRRIARDAGARFKGLVEAKTPVDTGHLKQSWKQKPVVEEPGVTGHATFRSGVETDVEYAPYVEHGTGKWGPKHAKYLIVPKQPGGVLHWVDSAGGHHFSARVMHPGSPGAHMVADSAGLLEAGLSIIALPALEEWRHEMETVP